MSKTVEKTLSCRKVLKPEQIGTDNTKLNKGIPFYHKISLL